MSAAAGETRFDIDAPLWDQSKFIGRFKHFAAVTDPRLPFVSTKQLLSAKELINSYRAGNQPAGTTRSQLVRAKKLYESSFHPDTGDLMNIGGRMCFQVPGGIILIGAMLIWYRSTPAVVFWQWVNQSFNALVNYTNRNAKSSLTVKQIGVAYASATSAALVTAVGLKMAWANHPSTLLQRLVPFIAVASANAVNIPLMRQNELISGVACTDEKGKPIATSHYAPMKGISQVVLSRIMIAAPGMIMTPVIMERFEKMQWFKLNRTKLNAPLQLLVTGLILIPSVPFGCSLFKQRSSIPFERLKWFDKQEYNRVKIEYSAKGEKLPERLYFNKGL